MAQKVGQEARDSMALMGRTHNNENFYSVEKMSGQDVPIVSGTNDMLAPLQGLKARMPLKTSHQNKRAHIMTKQPGSFN